MVVLQRGPRKSSARCLALVLAGLVPGRGADGEALCAADDTVEGIQLRSVDNGVLVRQEHLLAILKGVEYHSPGVAQFYLEHRQVVLPPPSLTCACMILAELEEMTKDWNGTRDLRQAFDMRDVG